MESYIYYIEGENGPLAYDYDQIIHALQSGQLSLNKGVVIYDPLTHYKKQCKLKELL